MKVEGIVVIEKCEKKCKVVPFIFLFVKEAIVDVNF